ncbi:FtsW/RodA/SpoVE family cell cycle protein [Streptococcus pluranimalium]|uniref:FtsW/RodA/SpoVE family cell cycle protein n=1 Tax=Streptococcus pluranimalium TaxID=82348 RepID=UPI001C4CC896|nr:FtsW/RodA/SpoVE family cell cycle protein [Streptococcus pluranimalium]WFM80425.1 FtsW/RodA/SpoVE family cell cycle protein [Streptococcus pluranimalium]HEM6115955.1 FtsW/RodA/SpoVE family cell cycle protein [Streptococcus suis]
MKHVINKRIDFILIIPVILLIITGFVAIYIATIHDYPDNIVQVMLQQVAWVVIGLGIAFAVMLFSTEFLWKVSPFLYVLGLILMILPLFFYSPAIVESTGSKNWITIGNTTLFQPSEFMKISYILLLSEVALWFHGRYPEQSVRNDLKMLASFLLVTLPILILLGLQKDIGTAMVFLAIFIGMSFLSGVSWKIVLTVFLVSVVSFLTFIAIFLWEPGREFLYHMGMDTYQINRISAWLKPFDFASSIAYQQTQSMLSIGSGGIFGKGFSVLELAVPVRESDMIFTVIAENFGFIGSVVTLSLYLLLIYRMILITLESNNQFYTYISTGFIMMILFHIFENIGAAIGILPLTGIPLPFISQGGSSLISNLIGVGLVLSMAYQNHMQRETEKNA